MFVTDAFAQAAGAPDTTQSLIGTFLPIVLMVLVFYFLLIRPQQKMRKQHQDMVAALKRGDVVVTSGGLIGKVKAVADDEIRVELAPNVEVRVIRGSISEVRTKSEPAPANDTKPGAAT
jgi:preprotein translocase subunit YajC